MIIQGYYIAVFVKFESKIDLATKEPANLATNIATCQQGTVCMKTMLEPTKTLYLPQIHAKKTYMFHDSWCDNGGSKLEVQPITHSVEFNT